MLKELIAEDITIPKPYSGWRGSEVGECPAFLCHLRLGHTAAPFTGRVRHMLDDGLMHEHDIIDRLRAKGIKVLYAYTEGQMDVECYDQDGLEVVGHPDGILDLPKLMGRFDLDYADPDFGMGDRFYMLEVTARSSFVFQRLLRQHLRESIPVKYVQTQMYLRSPEVREFGRQCVCEVKNKNTSELYEEGIVFHPEVVAETVEKLKKVEDAISRKEVLRYKCSDWRRFYCRYRDLCFAEGLPASVQSNEDVILDGSTLSEVALLEELAEQWKIGSPMQHEGKELVDDARFEFQGVIESYGVKGIEVAGVKAVMTSSHSRSVDYDALKRRYPTIYDEVVADEPTRYVRVTAKGG